VKKKERIKLRREKKEQKAAQREFVNQPVYDVHKGERNVKEYAKKFYQIMKNSPKNHYVNCIYLYWYFKDAGWGLGNDPHFLWRIWRQVENDFPASIDFLPQRPIFWDKKPSGWRYIGPPQYEKRRKKLR